MPPRTASKEALRAEILRLREALGWITVEPQKAAAIAYTALRAEPM